MRTIKFRAWNENDKKMYYDVQNTYDYGCTGDNQVQENRFADVLQDKMWEIMQYTGLKDKNGNEIYEGDILKYMAIADGEQIDSVIFDRGTFVVDYAEDYKQPINEINHCSEVIGNIYDNPELLEKGE